MLTKYEIGTQLIHILDGRLMVVTSANPFTIGKTTIYRTTARYVNQVSGRYEITDLVEGEAYLAKVPGVSLISESHHT
jgi:hypothetical protein